MVGDIEINISFFNHDSAIVIVNYLLYIHHWLILWFLVSNWQLMCSFLLLDIILSFWVWTTIFRHFNILNLREIFEFLQFFGIDNCWIIACGYWLLFLFKGIITKRALRMCWNTRLPLSSFISGHRRLSRFLNENSVIRG